MKIESINPNELNELNINPRKHPEEMLKKLENSIQTFGFLSPIIALKETKEILAGHARLKTAKKMKQKKVPVIFVDLDRDKALAYNVADNKIQEGSSWDFPLLKELIAEIDTGDFDIEITGFETGEIDNLFKNENKTLEFIEGENETEADDDVDIAQQSNIKMIQIFFTQDEYGEIKDKLEALMEIYKVNNITDAIKGAINEAIKGIS